MRESFTAGASRALDRAESRARGRCADHVELLDLLVALAEESESRAASFMAEFGLDLDRIQAHFPGPHEIPVGEGPLGSEPISLALSPNLRGLLLDATSLARSIDRSQDVGTEHLLAALLGSDDPASNLLIAAGLSEQAIVDRIHQESGVDTSPIPLAAEITPPQLTDPGEFGDLARILDASSNRAREGLRVVEDYVRFVLDDPGLTRQLKDVRHRFSQAIQAFDPTLMITARDTPGDVGTHIMTVSEATRGDLRAVLTANLKRTGEAMRSLEEYTKLSDPWLAGRFEVLRYDVYTLEKRLMAAIAARQGLGDARLYVLVGGLPTLGTLTWFVNEAIAGGADIIQLREKNRPDRELLSWAREVRILTAQAGVKFLMNDRPDLARLSGADGVHLGQDDISVRDARRVLGPNALIGVSTHDPAQLAAALRDGANYLGVGPVFPSGTKEFDDFAGLSFVRHAAESTNLPWFAIGGIHVDNLDEVLDAGATRIAVSGAVIQAERPRAAAAALKEQLLAIA